MESWSDTHKSGFVAIIGKPNAGKSTLLNKFMGRKLVIATQKAQTTRHSILGILNEPDSQIVFTDTPGVIIPKYALHKVMMKYVRRSLEDADLILLLIDVNEKFPEDELLKLIEQKKKTPKILVINKIDKANKEKIELRIKEFEDKIDFVDSISISALNGKNVDHLRDMVIRELPLGPPYFEKDEISDRPERFFVGELVREKIFMLLGQELPYSCEVSIASFTEEEEIVRISAEIHVSRLSQKGMIIGKKGSMIKKIGTQARIDIEEFLGKKVFLETYVRVTKNWKNDQRRLKDLGYKE